MGRKKDSLALSRAQANKMLAAGRITTEQFETMEGSGAIAPSIETTRAAAMGVDGEWYTAVLAYVRSANSKMVDHVLFITIHKNKPKAPRKRKEKKSAPQ